MINKPPLWTTTIYRPKHNLIILYCSTCLRGAFVEAVEQFATWCHGGRGPHLVRGHVHRVLGGHTAWGQGVGAYSWQSGQRGLLRLKQTTWHKIMDVLNYASVLKIKTILAALCAIVFFSHTVCQHVCIHDRTCSIQPLQCNKVNA